MVIFLMNFPLIILMLLRCGNILRLQEYNGKLVLSVHIKCELWQGCSDTGIRIQKILKTWKKQTRVPVSCFGGPRRKTYPWKDLLELLWYQDDNYNNKINYAWRLRTSTTWSRITPRFAQRKWHSPFSMLAITSLYWPLSGRIMGGQPLFVSGRKDLKQHCHRSPSQCGAAGRA